MHVTCFMPGFAGLRGETAIIFAFGPDKAFGGYCVANDSRDAALQRIAGEKFGPGTSWAWENATADYWESGRDAFMCVRSRAYTAAMDAKTAEQAKAAAERF